MKYQKTFRQTFHDYMDSKIKLKTYQKVGIVFLVVVIAGFIGWMYEFLLAIFEKGQIYMKGGNLLPWINIYAIGAILIVITTTKFKKYPWAVFLISFLVTGLLEGIAGWLVYKIGNGTRYWNYDHGIWNVCSINGFVCLASATAFGLSALLLMYVVLPFCTHLATHMGKKSFIILAATLFALIMLDEVVNLTLKNLDQPTAMDFYKSLGLEYQGF